ncbi:MAG: hypothetical protein KAH23_03275 [Kiritimatiellae bacterium]|nr:hypothetical protein [Kiritimatiellia bacterium]
MRTKILIVAVVFVLMTRGAGMAQKNQIPLDDMDNWYAEVFAGSQGGSFAQGPRRGSGSPGSMAFDKYGNTYVACGTFVYVITPDGRVSLLAGVPGTPGKADGPVSRACFGRIKGIAVGPDGFPYVADDPNSCIKKIHRHKNGPWMVTTVAGVAGRKGHKDGPALKALFKRLDCLTFGPDGAIYTMDQDWLRKIDDGKVTTLNPQGGTGYFEGALEKARFRRIMGAGAISTDPEGNIYISDKWGGVFRKADLKKGVTTAIAGGPARGQKGFGRARLKDGEAMEEARFHSGGGPNGAIYDPVTGRIYTITADEHAIRAITPNGFVRTLGPWLKGRKGVLEGPLRETAGFGTGALLGVDLQGRVYSARNGLIWRFYSKPPYQKGKKNEKGPNPLLVPSNPGLLSARMVARENLSMPPENVDVVAGSREIILNGVGEYQVGAVAAAGADGYFVAWQEGYSALGSQGVISFLKIGEDGKIGITKRVFTDGTCEAPTITYAAGTKKYLLAWQERPAGESGYQVRGSIIDGFGKPGPVLTLAGADGNNIHPVVVSDGRNFLVVWRRLFDSPEKGPEYEIVARLIDGNGKSITGPVQIAKKAMRPTATFDGSLYVVAYSTGRSVMTRRLDAKGAIVGDSVKMGGLWEHRPDAAANGKVVVVSASRRPNPNPWGWNGPGCIAVGRLTRDNKTPERFATDYHELADGGFAGLVDCAQWEGRKGWPAGIPGGFKKTANGYWPHLYSSVCWDGRAWVVAWVRGKLNYVSIYDHDIFALRIDPSTMMPTSEPALVAGGDVELGSKTAPVLASLGKGSSLLVYQAVQSDGRMLIAARILAGGPAAGPDRIEKKKSKKKKRR